MRRSCVDTPTGRARPVRPYGSESSARDRPPRHPGQAAWRPAQQGRDHAAISHHYDLSSDFYRLLLDETMACSCGYWSGDEPALLLADAQRAKQEQARERGLEHRIRVGRSAGTTSYGWSARRPPGCGGCT
ncbi:class I SAM-dependent methyltransferase [Streptomyces sp. JV185]|nr:class I SAM-dependent methyltransferase [Streptomyces sp. JV185]MEE1767587.1 class I SAM-dependent methyltransferase [Streptomyces sp. JV185]